MATSTAAGTQLSAVNVAIWAKAAGFKGDGLVTAVALALEESGGYTEAVNVNGDQWHSRDRGLWQLNDHWHAEVSDRDAFDPKAAAEATYRISKGGTDWSQWSAVPGRTSLPQYAGPARVAAAQAEQGTHNTTGAERDDDPAYLHPASSLVWSLLNAGLSSAAERIGVIAATYYANGKRDGFHWDKAVNKTLWPAVSDTYLASINAQAAELGKLTGQAAIATRIVRRFGVAALGASDATSTAWAERSVRDFDKSFESNPTYNPFVNETGDLGAAVEIDPVGALLDKLSNPLDALLALVRVLLNPALWIRLGLTLGGVAAIAAGLYVFTQSTQTGRNLTAGAAKAAAVAA